MFSNGAVTTPTRGQGPKCDKPFLPFQRPSSGRPSRRERLVARLSEQRNGGGGGNRTHVLKSIRYGRYVRSSRMHLTSRSLWSGRREASPVVSRPPIGATHLWRTSLMLTSPPPIRHQGRDASRLRRRELTVGRQLYRLPCLTSDGALARSRKFRTPVETGHPHSQDRQRNIIEHSFKGLNSSKA